MKRWLPLIVLLELITLALTSHMWHLGHFHAPADLDSGFHLWQAGVFDHLASTPGPLLEKFVSLWTWPGLYPQGVYLSTWIANLVLHQGVAGTTVSLGLFVALMALGAYSLGYEHDSVLHGLAATLLVLGDPTLLHDERRYWLDMPLAATVLCSLALLSACDGFARRRESLAFGLCCGFALLCKFTAVWFLAPPLIWLLVAAYRATPDEEHHDAALMGWIALWVGAYLALTRYVVQQNNALVLADTLVPRHAWWVLGAWLTTCTCSALLAWKGLHGRIRHAAWSVTLVALVAGPWFLVNQWYIKMRWEPVARDLPATISRFPQALASYAQSVPEWLLIASILGLARIIVWPERERSGPLLAMSYFAGLLCTLTTLPPTDRYAAPIDAVLALLALAWIPRQRMVRFGVCVLATGYFAFNLFGLMKYDALVSFWREHPSLYQTLTRTTCRAVADAYTTDRPDLGSEAQALLKAFPKAQTVCLICDETRLEQANQLWYMLQAGAEWDRRLLSVRVLKPAGDGSFEEMEQDPAAAARLRMLARWKGVSVESFPKQHVLDAPPPDLIVATETLANPTQLAQTLFHASYQVQTHPDQDGLVRLSRP